jgi:hypothetical protein
MNDWTSGKLSLDPVASADFCDENTVMMAGFSLLM